MDKRELNRDVKNLARDIKQVENDPKMPITHWNIAQETFKKEFLRLHGADRELKYMSAESIKTMIGINHKYKFIAHFLFFDGAKY